MFQIKPLSLFLLICASKLCLSATINTCYQVSAGLQKDADCVTAITKLVTRLSGTKTDHRTWVPQGDQKEYYGSCVVTLVHPYGRAFDMINILHSFDILIKGCQWGKFEYDDTKLSGYVDDNDNVKRDLSEPEPQRVWNETWPEQELDLHHNVETPIHPPAKGPTHVARYVRTHTRDLAKRVPQGWYQIGRYVASGTGIAYRIYSATTRSASGISPDPRLAAQLQQPMIDLFGLLIGGAGTGTNSRSTTLTIGAGPSPGAGGRISTLVCVLQFAGSAGSWGNLLRDMGGQASPYITASAVQSVLNDFRLDEAFAAVYHIVRESPEEVVTTFILNGVA